MMNMMQPIMMVVRRPIKSAISPAAIAPKKVPQERMDVMSDFFQAGSVKAASSAFVALGPGIGRPW
jgi:hypothetical protein